MAPWFSASAVGPALASAGRLGPTGAAWLTISVQLGFVAGALVSAVLTLSDRWSARRLAAAASLAAAAATLGVAFSRGPVAGFALRVATGAALAGVYPPGMKIAAGWFRDGRGWAIGMLVGALTLGSAAPARGERDGGRSARDVLCRGHRGDRVLAGRSVRGPAGPHDGDERRDGRVRSLRAGSGSGVRQPDLDPRPGVARVGGRGDRRFGAVLGRRERTRPGRLRGDRPHAPDQSGVSPHGGHDLPGSADGAGDGVAVEHERFGDRPRARRVGDAGAQAAS